MTPTKSFEEIFESLPSKGWLSKAEAKLLWDICLKYHNISILEVGCYHGRSTVLLSSFGSIVYSVDPFDGFDSDLSGDLIQEAFLKNLKSRNINNVILYRESIETWVAKPVGFAYLDGDHTFEGTKIQIKKALECNPNCIAIHDVNDSGGGLNVKEASIELLGPWNIRVERLAIWQLRNFQ